MTLRMEVLRSIPFEAADASAERSVVGSLVKTEGLYDVTRSWKAPRDAGALLLTLPYIELGFGSQERHLDLRNLVGMYFGLG